MVGRLGNTGGRGKKNGDKYLDMNKWELGRKQKRDKEKPLSSESQTLGNGTKRFEFKGDRGGHLSSEV